MTELTEAQEAALKRLWLRCPVWVRANDEQDLTSDSSQALGPVVTYEEFKARVQPGWDCIMIRWCGMWVGIEKDGYTHT
jgi:hypothetical protein